MNWRFDWRDAALKRKIAQIAEELLADIGLAAERASKAELYPGHGEDTSTMKKSIHTAQPGYDWGSDDVEPGPGTPERGGNRVKGVTSGNRTTLELGSGLRYAMAQHQGFNHYRNGFIPGYHYLVKGAEKVRPQLAALAGRYKLDR